MRIPSDFVDRLESLYPPTINLGLDRILVLLEKLGNPQNRLPPLLHVAGTNGKGSTLAFAQAILESMGWRVHTYTSPHLIHLRERIRVAGHLLDDQTLLEQILACEKINNQEPLSFFELITATAFHTFAQVPADAVLLETGLGGRLDATNVVERPAVIAITRLSFDHTHLLGTTLREIACEKAGIFRPGVPVVLTPQPDASVNAYLKEYAASMGMPIIDWKVNPTREGFTYQSRRRTVTLPPPRLTGAHQMLNAGGAIACSEVLGPISDAAIYRGVVQTVSWPGRLESLTDRWDLAEGHEVWIDGGHNDSAAEILGDQIDLWASEYPLEEVCVILGMGIKKDPDAFLAPLSRRITALRAVPISCTTCVPPQDLVQAGHRAGIDDSQSEPDVETAIRRLSVTGSRRRFLICGSLYLVAEVFERLGKEIV